MLLLLLLLLLMHVTPYRIATVMMVRGGGRATIVFFLLTGGIRTNKHQSILLVVAQLATEGGGCGSCHRLRPSHFRLRRRVAAKGGRIIDETIGCRQRPYTFCYTSC
uniref:Putative secreted protein n=1 Tax=Anopheles marajoara TaxID=58244 RepID=A0A2M4C872_9DIPT